MFGNKKKLVDGLQAQGGTVAWATVLKSQGQWQSSSSSGSRTNHVKLSVRVEPDGGESFEATFKQAFPGTYPMTGWQCKVIFDPEDHSRIAVVEGSEAPPGISHERAERGAALRVEAIQAARSGNVAEFVEQMRARAMEQAGAAGAGAPQILVNGQPLVVGAQQPPEPEPQVDVADQLAKLASLHQQGILTDEEFQAAKAKLLT